MGLKLSRKIRKIREKILIFIRNRSLLSYKLIILLSSILKFLNKKNKKKSYQKFSENLNYINKYEFKITSQNNEDGIIEFILNKIDIKKVNFVEIGFDYYENNSLNLLSKTQKGLFIDGSDEKVFKLKYIMSLLYPLKKIQVIKSFINKDNINSIIKNYFPNGEDIDFLSIDVDGNDYYIFENLKIKPKLICIEYNFWFGSEIKCSIPYDKNFTWEMDSLYSGASLNALCSLAKKKGYCLIALESNCVNVFFIRSDLKDKFEILDNIKNFRTPKKYTINEIKNANELLLNEKLNRFK